jgi:hypothetical protein
MSKQRAIASPRRWCHQVGQLDAKNVGNLDHFFKAHGAITSLIRAKDYRPDPTSTEFFKGEEGEPSLASQLAYTYSDLVTIDMTHKRKARGEDGDPLRDIHSFPATVLESRNIL